VSAGTSGTNPTQQEAFMKKKFMLCVVLFAGICFAFSLPLFAAVKVKIGLAHPITGPSSNDGQMARDGAILALELSKNRPELKQYELLYASEDDKSDPKDAAAIGNKFAGDSEVFAVIGNYNSSCTLAAASILTKAGIVQISPGSSSPKITGYSKYLLRTNPTDKIVGANIVKWAKEMGFKKIAVVYESSDFGKGLQHIYMDLWPGQEGYEILANEAYLPGTTLDMTPILTKIKQSKAEAVLLGSLYNEASLIAKQAKQLRLDIPFFGDVSQHTNALLELGGKSVEGWRVVGAMDANSKDDLTVTFLQNYEKRFGRAPNTFAAQAYDAMNIILQGLAQNGPDREKLAEYVGTVKNFPGVTGKLTFEKGDVEKQLFRFIVDDGKFKQVQK
jgi:branched-chain amino acid transport system substrate-binding protein